MELLRGIEKPEFTGIKGNFNEFKRKRKIYLETVGEGENMKDRRRIQLLRQFLRGNVLGDFELKLATNDSAWTYDAFMSHLEANFSIGEQQGARKKWRQVGLSNTGKITSEDWEEYRIAFMTAMRPVENATETEARE